ncbi:MAG: MerR family transcriptional regulator [Bacteroidota bacterium]
MSMRNNEITKLYYSIGEISEMFNVSKSLIRFWESEFDILKPHKNSKGDRRFTQQNIDQFKIIHHLVKDRGFTLEGAKREIKLNKDRLTKRNKTLDSLIRLKGFLEELKASI